jgi:hypothetical protein
MWRRLIVVVLLLGGLGLSNAAAPLAAPSEPAQTHLRYFPLITHDILPLDLVITARGATWGYPSHVYVYGYLHNRSDQTFRDTKIELVETWYPYDPVGDPEPYTTTIRMRGALTATLPGQINPFAHSVLVGKSSVFFSQVSLVDGRPQREDEAPIVALEAGEWTHDGEWTLTGTVRNTSAHTVRGVRVVVTTLGACEWHRASPEKTRLVPGEETAYTAGWFGSGCTDEEVVVLGQGVVEQ